MPAPPTGFELILIENNSKQPETFRAYERMQKEHPDNLKVVTWEGKGFNYSALNNFGEQYATGEYLLLLNNDTEVITPQLAGGNGHVRPAEAGGLCGCKAALPR